MAKKKNRAAKNKDINVDSPSIHSTDDERNEEEKVNGETECEAVRKRCPHAGKAVHLPPIKKNLKTAWAKVGQCGLCVKEKKVMEMKERTFWLCLRCGLQYCDVPFPENGTLTCEGHLGKHLETPKSDLHCLFINVVVWKIWYSDLNMIKF